MVLVLLTRARADGTLGAARREGSQPFHGIKTPRAELADVRRKSRIAGKSNGKGRRIKKKMLMPIIQAAVPLAARGAAEIDLELFTFVERYATNLFRWDLILFFGTRPDEEWSSADIAVRLNRSVYATTKELDDLTYLRILVRHYTPERTTYRLSKRASVRRAATSLADLERSPRITPAA